MVIITGANRGIGEALTQKVLLSGMACCAVVRDQRKYLESLEKKQLEKLFVTDYQLDFFVEGVIKIDQIPLSFITLVLNAFDISPIKRITELSQAEIMRNIDFNITKQIEILRKAWELSQATEAPLRIVSLDSGAAYKPVSGWSLYCAGKAYLDMFLRVFAKETEAPVVLYDPGVVDTNMQEFIRSKTKHDFPQVDVFQQYYHEKQLHAPEAVAQNILDRYILSWSAKTMAEKYEA